MNPIAIIPRDALPRYSNLGKKATKEFHKWVGVIDALTKVSGRTLGKEMAAQASHMHVSKGHVRRKWDEWVNSHGDWTVLVDKKLAGADWWDSCREALPAAFVEFWQAECGNNQRNSIVQRGKLMRRLERWRNGDETQAIPGYTTPPENEPETDHPRGWSKRNLHRKLPTKHELVARRQGLSASADFRPLTFTTRKTLRVGQFIMFDDLWHDFKVNVMGQRHAQRLLQFHAHDLFSACNFARGMKPVMENEVTGAQERLKEKEMIFLLAHVLTNYGYREEGTWLVAEHATAAISGPIEQMLYDLSDGKIRVDRGGIEGKAAFAGMYGGRSKGNFRFKASLESSHNLIHNATADITMIPGQTGSNSRLNAPEELHGRERHNDALIRAMAALPPERASLLRLPFLEFNQAMRLVDEIHDHINRRTDHDLEGWIEAGLVAQEFRLALDFPWMSSQILLNKTPEERLAVEAVITTNDNLIRTRKLSPREVFDQGVKELVKMPDHVAALLVGDLPKIELPAVKRNLITFECMELSPSPLRFLAKIGTKYLGEGEKFSGVVNPMNLKQIMLFNAKGGYVGTCEEYGLPSRDDTDALNRQMGKANKVLSDLLKPVAAHGAAITRQRLADTQHNAEVLNPPKTTEEKSEEKRIQKSSANISDFLAPLPGADQAGT